MCAHPIKEKYFEFVDAGLIRREANTKGNT